MDISVFKSYQIDVGVNPGQIPVINANRSISIYNDPIEDTDAVNKGYLHKVLTNNTVNTSDIESYKSTLVEYLNNLLYNSVKTPALLYDVYREKYDQAVDLLSGYSIELCPLIKIDAEVYNITYTQAANNILDKRKEWLKNVTKCEATRLKFNQDIQKSCTNEELDQIKYNIDQMLK